MPTYTFLLHLYTPVSTYTPTHSLSYVPIRQHLLLRTHTHLLLTTRTFAYPCVTYSYQHLPTPTFAYLCASLPGASIAHGYSRKSIEVTAHHSQRVTTARTAMEATEAGFFCLLILILLILRCCCRWWWYAQVHPDARRCHSFVRHHRRDRWAASAAAATYEELSPFHLQRLSVDRAGFTSTWLSAKTGRLFTRLRVIVNYL